MSLGVVYPNLSACLKFLLLALRRSDSPKQRLHLVLIFKTTNYKTLICGGRGGGEKATNVLSFVSKFF